MSQWMYPSSLYTNYQSHYPLDYVPQRKHQQLNRSANLRNFVNFQASNWSQRARIARQFSSRPSETTKTTASTISAEELAQIEKDLNTEAEPFVKEGKENLIGYWLLFFSFSVALMIAVGGYTRLSKSGLSMVRWKPINYKLPHSLEEWNVEFEAYKQYPEYKLSPEEVTLEKFKFIFFVEWAHRTLGNAIGGILILPFTYFAIRRYFRPRMLKRMSGLLLMLGTQGLIGWWMVKSGLHAKPDYHTSPRVSVYRLFVHLNAAMMIYGFALWHGLTLIRQNPESVWNPKNFQSMNKVRGYSKLLLFLVTFNIASGSIVAGLDAGKVFNTWPDMNGA